MNAHWAARLRLAGRLGVSPHDFWRLSVAEWRALTGGETGPQPMGRAAFEDLSTQFPDRKNG